MDLSADRSGLIPSDLDVERGLVGCLPQTRFPLLTLRELLGFSGSRVNRVRTALIENGRVENGRVENGRVEKVLVTDGRPRRLRLPRDLGIGQSVQPDNSRCQTEQTTQSSQVGPDGHP